MKVHSTTRFVFSGIFLGSVRSREFIEKIESSLVNGITQRRNTRGVSKIAVRSGRWFLNANVNHLRGERNVCSRGSTEKSESHVNRIKQRRNTRGVSKIVALKDAFVSEKNKMEDRSVTSFAFAFIDVSNVVTRFASLLLLFPLSTYTTDL